MTFSNLQSILNRLLVFTTVSSPQILSFGFLSSKPAFAQIVPDNTLSISSQVTIDGKIHTIDGGTAAGTNLFHSFESFSVPAGTEAFFNNATTIENILTRVTGGNISNIDGLIRANGTANLFLLNPNGLVFGPNARLDIGGSFFGSTADSLVFENGWEFSATAPEAQPLLSVNVPIGLQVGSHPGEIRVEGPGHEFTPSGPDILFSPINRGTANTGLQVNAGQTLALIGGNISLEGGIVTAEGGQVELGAVATGSVSLNPLQSGGFALDYNGVETFRDISLSQQATADASGVGSGSIQIAGGRVALIDGAIVLIQSQASHGGGDIGVTASALLTVDGTNPDGSILSGFRTDTLAAGQSADITVTTRQLVVRGGGQIFSRTSSTGNAGKVTVNASESIEVSGDSPISAVFSLIGGTTAAEGNAGDVEISTRRLSLFNGGTIGSTSFGFGNGGNLTINVADFIELRGVAPTSPLISASINSATASSGNAGNTTVNTARLTVEDGAFITSSTTVSGTSGSITINASESVEVTGVSDRSPSRIGASGDLLFSQETRQSLGLPPFLSGDSGNVTINTPQLTVSNGAEVSVGNEGTGFAGNLQIRANRIGLRDRGQFTAATASGEGGNIALQVQDSLQLRRTSQITAEAGGSGNGGNVAISADTIVLLEGSTISANAFEGMGGNIEIAAQGLFLSPENSITASSQLGVDGIVAITEPEIDTSWALVSLSDAPINPTTQIVSTCGVARENSLVVTGNGGLPPDPTQLLTEPALWVDMRLSEIRASSPPVEASPSEAEENSFAEAVRSTIEPQTLVEATGWQRYGDGTVELVVKPQGQQVGNHWLDRPVCPD
ncbi:MAG: S-layer family protein [Cyanobacteria bacterium SBC]|nr:S-layer family protein [Cyanobacteria bacterium SBC]